MNRTVFRSSTLHSAISFAQRFFQAIRWRIHDSYRWTPYVSFFARLVLRIRKPFIIGVTGSVGKTTTKEMIGAVLTRPEAEPLIGRVVKTPKNMNDDLGLPLTVLLFKDWLDANIFRRFAVLFLLPLRVVWLAFTRRYPDVFVLEYGTSWNGHIHRLAVLAPPRIAAITAIGPAHLERHKTLEGVANEKCAIICPVGPDGLVVLGDVGRFVSHFERLSQAPILRATGYGVELSCNIASAIARHLGIPDEVIGTALEGFEPPQGRMNRVEAAGLTIIDASYNANPLSMQFGLDTLARSIQPGQRRVAVLGSMAELGDGTRAYHHEIGIYARSRTDLLIGVGDAAKDYMPDHWFVDSDACASGINGLVRSGDCVFIKGSASVRMSKVVAKLTANTASR